MDLRGRAASFLLGMAALVTAVPVIVQIHQIQLHTLVQGIVVWVFRILLLSPGILALRAYGDAFRCKRQMFASSPPLGDQAAGRRASIYGMENDLYLLIGQQKRTERLSDYVAYVLALIAVSGYLMWRLLAPAPYFASPATLVVIVAGISFAAWRLTANVLRRRGYDR
jgi:hypothetical protein